MLAHRQAKGVVFILWYLLGIQAGLKAYLARS